MSYTVEVPLRAVDADSLRDAAHANMTRWQVQLDNINNVLLCLAMSQTVESVVATF